MAAMTYTFARVGAVVALNVEDYYPQGPLFRAASRIPKLAEGPMLRVDVWHMIRRRASCRH